MPDQTTKQPSLKLAQALADLEQIVAEFESGEIDLEKGVREYERGKKLAAFLKERLAQIGNEIEEIKTDAVE